jgi:hypothetical protein
MQNRYTADFGYHVKPLQVVEHFFAHLNRNQCLTKHSERNMASATVFF